MGVKSRISHVQIASDDLVARVGIAGVVSLVPRQVVVIHVAMNAVVAVEVDVVDVPANDISVDLDVGIAIIHVDVGDPDDRAATGDPAAAPPPMIVNTTRVPVAVVVQPRPDRERRTEKDDAGWRQAVIGGRAEINHIRVVRRDVDVLRLRGNDIEKVAVHIHLLLLVRDEIARGISQRPQALDRRVQVLEAVGCGKGWIEGDIGHGRAYQFEDPDGHLMEVYYEVQKYVAPAP